MNKKRVVILFVVMIATLFTACAKNKEKAAVKENSGIKVEVQSTESDGNKELEEICRLVNSIIADTNDKRMAAEISISMDDIEEFMADLDKVQKSEKTFSSDDLSPFFLIDKKHNVADNYVPEGLIPLVSNNLYQINKNNLSLRPEAYQALNVLAEAAKKDGVTLTVSSTYRSYEYQKNLFDYWVSVDGLEEAERESARPGTSQHQLGMALDFAPVDDAFDQTAAGAWVYKNAAKYGWSLSFPKNYEDVTGYRWECWHFRYIGKEACDFQRKWFNDVQQYMLEFLDTWNTL